MTNHPNRSKKAPREGRNPSAEEVINARTNAGLTQEEAAALVYVTVFAWRKWEYGERRMMPATWELLQIKLKDLSTPKAPAK